MSNKEIANYFQELADLMELHKENPFKIKSYRNAYIQLRKLPTSLVEMSEEEISKLKGIGKATTSKIQEIKETQQLKRIQEYKEKTPSGILEMLKIKGFGPSKVRVVWQDLKCENVGELLYACNENRLVTLKGFGAKTQADLIKKINFFFRSRNKFHYAKIEKVADEVLQKIKNKLPQQQVALVGQIRRKCIIVDYIDVLIDTKDIQSIFDEELIILSQLENIYHAKTQDDFPVRIYTCTTNEWGSKLFKYTTTKEFVTSFLEQTTEKDFTNIAEEKEIFKKANIPYVVPELRENGFFVGKEISNLVEEKDIKGVIHTHTVYSDGMNTIEEMANYAQGLGYEYIVITDHSKAAFYANGLKEDRIIEQWKEIDELNQKYNNFKIYKGIESDILYDGSLDYEEEILKGFDVIIASVHSNLKMFKDKATERLITAIKNPYTTILGHPTGRLLLSRQGYPIDHKKIIDACSKNNVAIELNANPLRLDLDYNWISYAMEQGVKIAINPDAHSTKGIHDIHYGVLAARKGGLTTDFLFSL